MVGIERYWSYSSKSVVSKTRRLRQRMRCSLQHRVCSNWSLQVWVFKAERNLSKCQGYHRLLKVMSPKTSTGYEWLRFKLKKKTWFKFLRGELTHWNRAMPGMFSGQFVCRLEKLHRCDMVRYGAGWSLEIENRNRLKHWKSKYLEILKLETLQLESGSVFSSDHMGSIDTLQRTFFQ